MIWLIPLLCSGAICWMNREQLTPAPLMALPPPPAWASYGPPQLPYTPPPPQLLAYSGVPGAGAAPGTGQSYPVPSSAPLPEGTYVAAPAAFSAPPQQPAFSSPPQPTAPPQPIALLHCATDACPIRPMPTAWDDNTMGRMPGSFTAPRDYDIYILSFGPVGWAEVLVNHPDEGAVQGWVETKNLYDRSPQHGASPQTPPRTTSLADSTSQSGAPSTGRVVAATKEEAMARHAQFAAKQKRPPPQTPVRAPRRQRGR